MLSFGKKIVKELSKNFKKPSKNEVFLAVFWQKKLSTTKIARKGDLIG